MPYFIFDLWVSDANTFPLNLVLLIVNNRERVSQPKMTNSVYLEERTRRLTGIYIICKRIYFFAVMTKNNKLLSSG